MADAILLVGVMCWLSWMGLVAPAILRTFGVPVAFGIRQLNRHNRNLTRMQYVVAWGIFAWGLGMFLFFVVHHYLEWKLLGYAFSYQSPGRIIVGLLICLAAGCGYGVSTWR